MVMTYEKYSRQLAVMLDSMLMQVDPKDADSRWDDQRWVLENFTKFDAAQPHLSAVEKVRRKTHEEETE